MLLLFTADPAAYGDSQARGQIGATAAGLRQSHSNAESLAHGVRLGIEPTTSWFPIRFVSPAPREELPEMDFESRNKHFQSQDASAHQKEFYLPVKCFDIFVASLMAVGSSF